MSSITFTAEDYAELAAYLNRGNISDLSKQQLERYAVLLCRPQASQNFPGGQFPQACDTIRLLLLARISEEANRESKRISIIALWISAFALLAGVVQVFVAVGYLPVVSSQVSHQPAPSSAAVPVRKSP